LPTETERLLSGDLTLRERRLRGILAHARERAERTEARLKIARPLWLETNRTVREIARISGLSRRTLYNHLPLPRTQAQQGAREFEMEGARAGR
jgi:DNA-binding transcriptional ArsR family regulator